MNLITGLFRAARKKLLTHDNDMGGFRAGLTEIVEKKDTLSDEDISAKVEELKTLCEDLPDSDNKANLLRFLEDFKHVKEQDPEVAKEAGDQVADLFEKLDTEAMQDIPDAGIKDDGEPAKTDEPKDDGAGEPTPEDPPVDDPEKKEPAEPKDDDGTKKDDYALEEIYQFIKKRMAEDTGAGEPNDGDCGTKDGDKDAGDDDKKDGMVGDGAPVIPVTVNNNNANNGGLNALFNSMKKGV